MKNIMIFFMGVLMLSIVSCKSDSKEVNVAEDDTTSTLKNNTSMDHSAKSHPVSKVYKITEVDQAPLFDASCANQQESVACSNAKVRQYIANHVNKEPSAKRNEVITFLIEADGSIGGTIRSLTKNEVCAGCRESAIKVISNMPKWLPAVKDGVNVPVQMTLPVTFGG